MLAKFSAFNFVGEPVFCSLDEIRFKTSKAPGPRDLVPAFPLQYNAFANNKKIRKFGVIHRGPQREDAPRYSARDGSSEPPSFRLALGLARRTPSEPEQETLNSAQSTFWTRPSARERA